MLFDSVFKIISNFTKDIISFETVVTDQESALINIVNKYFPNTRRITCFFHYKEDLIRNLRKYGLLKDKLKQSNKIIIGILSCLPIIYKGDMNLLENILNNIKEDEKLKIYTNYIEN